MVAGRDSHSRSKSPDRRSRTRATVKRAASLVSANAAPNGDQGIVF